MRPQRSTTSESLVGRSEELAWLRYCIDSATRGVPHVVVVSGEPGIGKSRLLQTLEPTAHELGAALGFGRGYEDVPIPYMAWEELLRSLLDDCRAAGVEVSEQESPLALFDEPASNTSDASPFAGRARLFLEISNRLLLLAAKRPLVLTFDDLQWLEDSSLALLSRVVSAISDASRRRFVPIAIVVSTRPVEPESAAARLLGVLKREQLSDVLEVAGLDEHDTTRLITATGIRRPSTQLATTILETTRGNPLFVEAMVEELVQSGALSVVAGVAVSRQDPAELQLSPDVSAATRARLTALPRETQDLLEHASLMGQCFAPELLADVVGLSLSELLSTLDPARDGLVRASGGAMEFASPLLRHLASQHLPRARRQQMHAHIAGVLMKAGRVDSGEWAVARHLMLAGDRADTSQLLEYGRRAGDWAAARCAWNEAGEAYSAAAGATADAGEIGRLHFLAARCFMKNYDIGPLGLHYKRALEGYREAGDPEGMARVLAESARIDLYRVPMGQLRESEPFDRALDELPTDSWSLRGLLLARMADAHFYAYDSESSIRLAGEALEYGQRAGDHDLCADACIIQGLALLQGMQFEGAEESYRRALHHVEASGDRWLECGSRVRYAMLLFTIGKLAECELELARALDATLQLNDQGEEALSLAHRSLLEASRGQLDEVEKSAQAALRFQGGFELGFRPWVPLFALPALAYSRFLRGDTDGADDALAALAEPSRVLGRPSGGFLGLSNVLRALVGTFAHASAVATVDTVPELIQHYGRRFQIDHADGSALGIVGAVVELASMRGMIESVTGPIQVLEHALQAGAVLCNGWPSLIPRVLGSAAFANGDPDGAAQHFQDGLGLAKKFGISPELARTQLDYAGMLVSQGGYEREHRARDLLEAAITTFDRLGMTPFAERARNLARAIGIEVFRASQPAEGLGTRDLDLLRRLQRGNSDAAIAADLSLRQETVCEMVRALLRRLGVDGRKGAVAHAVARGLVAPAEGGVPLTLLVSDLVRSTDLLERLGDVEAQRVMQQHNRILRSSILEHSGIEVAHTGDGIIASFRSGAEATVCAIALQQRFALHNRSAEAEALEIRIGLHSGRPLPDEAGRLVGIAVNTAVRICSHCAANDIMASARVVGAASGLEERFTAAGAVALRGIQESVELFHVEWRDSVSSNSDTTASNPGGTPP